MSRMLERVARALFEDNFGEHASDADWEYVRDNYLDDARVAVRAMLEPTEAMVSVGWDQMNVNVDTDDAVTDIWQAMIREALHPKPVPVPPPPYCKCAGHIAWAPYDVTPIPDVRPLEGLKL